MNKFNWLWVLVLLVILLVGWVICAKTPKNAPQRQIEPFNAILQSNSFFPISPVEFPHIQVLASKIVNCESGGDNNAIGKAGERGIAQFMKGTFEWMSELSGLKGNWLNEEDQWKLLLWALEQGYGSHWTCLKLIK